MTNKLIILDFPVGYKFGIDLKYYQTGPNFRGVKRIPSGTHYIYYGVEDDYCNSGFFLNMIGNEIFVKKWNSEEADLVDYSPTELDIELYESQKANLDMYLGTYEMTNHKQWWSLSNHISSSVIKKLMPKCGRIYSVDQYDSPSSTTQERLNAAPPKLDSDGLVELKIDANTKINLISIPKYMFPTDLGENKTTHMLDKSFLLDSVLEQRQDNNDDSSELFLGEIQFTFLAYTLSYKLDCFEQWLSLVELLCNSTESSLITRPSLYRNFVAVLFHQLNIAEDDFADISTNVNKFYLALKRMFDVVKDLGSEGRLEQDIRSRMLGLKESIERKFDWDFSEDLDDELPVIVDVADLEIKSETLMELD